MLKYIAIEAVELAFRGAQRDRHHTSRDYRNCLQFFVASVKHRSLRP